MKLYNDFNGNTLTLRVRERVRAREERRVRGIYRQDIFQLIRIEPYSATHQVWRQNEDGGLRQHWKPCRVLGIACQDGEPRYVIETYSNGESALELVDSVRTNA